MDCDAQALQRGRVSRSSVSSSTIIGLIIIFLLTINHLSLKPNADQRRKLLFLFQDNDYKTVTSREGHPLNEVVIDSELQHHYEESPLFVVPEANLAATRHVVPTVIRNRLPLQGSAVVDIVSIGSKTRLEFLTAQMNTWANLESVRNFWGVTEEQDYDANCFNASEVDQKAFMNLCWPGGSRRGFKGWGWFCAQRRPGHALGWLQTLYQDPANIPDMLIIVDDDTSVDVNFAIHQMSLVVDNHAPYVGNPCVFRRSGAGHGGMGTFFNRVAIEGLTRPIFCNDQQLLQAHHNESSSSMNAVCEGLIAKTSINAELFQEGDSIFDIFYKYSAVHKFCLFSDGAMANMINGYTEITGGLKQFGQRSYIRGCPSSGVISCHFQYPGKMNQFALDRQFIIPKADLDTTKHAAPTVIQSNPTFVTHMTYGDSCPTKTDGNCNGSCDCRFSWPTNVESRAPWKSSQAKCRCKKDLPAHNSMVVDVLSIGSKTRLEFLVAQMETWASHYSVRNFWGVTEEQDYDVNCGEQSQEALGVYLQSCRTESIGAKFRHASFGHRPYDSKGWGWFCAQRRPGHALGWLQSMYQDPTYIPDILIIVDEDTAVDIEVVQLWMSEAKGPRVGNPCAGGTMSVDEGSLAGMGGAGTFFNRAAIERLSEPLYCDNPKHQSMNSTCERLQDNQVGEHDVFQQGDSVFDIFYKYSALRDFCMHSDWAMGYMINAYSGSSLEQFGQCLQRSPGDCPVDALYCRYQNPEAMKHFALHHRIVDMSHVSWNTLRTIHLRQPWNKKA